MSERPKVCVTGADPDEPFPVPLDSEFDGREFLLAAKLETVGAALIDRADELGDLDAYPPAIRYAWRRKGKKTKGQTILGFCNKTSGLSKFFGECDFVIEVAADAVRDLKLTHFQIEALLFHELTHIWVVVDEKTDEASYKVRADEYTAFIPEIARYGAWRSDLEKVADSFAQAPLFADAKPHRKRADGATATVTANGRTVDLDDEAGVREVVGAAIDGALRRAAVADRVNLVSPAAD